MNAAVKYLLAIICFGFGAAFFIWTIGALREGNPYGDDPAWIPGILGAVFLLATFLLLRWKTS